MTTKVYVNFILPDNSGVITKKFAVQHLRNYEKNSNGGVIKSPNGGYTVLCDDEANMVVATCNFRTDRFSRKAGLKEAFSKYVKYKMCEPNIKGVYAVVAYQDNGIDVFLEA
jgi:hypothetical protein